MMGAYFPLANISEGMTEHSERDDLDQASAIGGLDAEFIMVDGVRTRYYDEGEGDPLLLIHGGSWSGELSANDWWQNIPSLSDEFRVVAPDRLGSGMTDAPEDPADWVYEAEVDHMLAFIEGLDLDGFHLVGHSRGAGLTGAIAVERPETVKSLTVLNSQTLAMESGDYFHRRTRSLLRGLPDPEVDGYEANVRAVFEGYAYGTEHLTDEYVRAAALMKGRPESRRIRRGMETGQRLPFRLSIRDRMRRTQDRIRDGAMDMPVLLYWGRNDWGGTLLTAVGLYDMIAQPNPYVRLKLVNECGHFPFQEYPAEFDADLSTFIHHWADLDVADREVRERWKAGIDLEN